MKLLCTNRKFRKMRKEHCGFFLSILIFFYVLKRMSWTIIIYTVTVLFRLYHVWKWGLEVFSSNSHFWFSRSKRTQAETMKLKRIQKELQALDDMVSADIGILRNRIDQASLEYSYARWVGQWGLKSLAWVCQWVYVCLQWSLMSAIGNVLIQVVACPMAFPCWNSSYRISWIAHLHFSVSWLTFTYLTFVILSISNYQIICLISWLQNYMILTASLCSFH